MISSISDVHIRKNDDERAQLLLSFLNHEKVQNSKYVFLLGDIFDLMVGNHSEYLEKYSEIFETIAKICRDGKKVYFFEGNHDFHLNEFFQEFVLKYKLGTSFFFSSSDLELTFKGVDFYFSHGDDIEIENPSYKIYKNLMRNPFMNLVANKVAPFHFVEAVGQYASSQSRKRNEARYSDQNSSKQDEVKQRFRRAADLVKITSPSIKYLIAGHSHIKDHYNSPKGFSYLNNGFLPKTKSFIYLNQQLEVSFVDLK